MTRERYRVVAVEVAEHHDTARVWRVRVRPVEQMQLTFALYVSQPTGRPVPHDVGALLDLDERLLERAG